MLRNVSLYGFARIGPAAINFFAIALYARLLGPAEYGRYALVVASVGLALALGFTWLRVGLIRLLPAHEARKDEFLSTLLGGFVRAAAGSLVVAAILWGLTGDPRVRWLIPGGLVLLWAQAAFELNLDLSVSRLEPVRYGLITLMRSVLGVGSAWLLVSRGHGVAGLLTGVILGLVVPVLWTARRNWSGASPRRGDPQMLAEVVQYSLPLVATLSLELVVNASDRFFLGWFSGADAVGAYAVGYDLSQQSLTLLLVTVNLAAWPAVLRALETGGAGAARSRMEEQGMLLACVGLPAAAGLALVAPNVVHLFLGAEYQESAARLIPYIALATLVGGAKSYYFDLSFQLGKATHHQVWIMLAAAVTNVACNLFWIPRHGAMGAAWATIAAYAVGLVISWWRGRAVFPMPLPWTGWGRVALATVAMAAALLPLHGGRGVGVLVLQLAVGVGSFGAAAVLLDLLDLRSRLRRVQHRLTSGRAGS